MPRARFFTRSGYDFALWFASGDEVFMQRIGKAADQPMQAAFRLCRIASDARDDIRAKRCSLRRLPAG
jgi:hypothetical protein